MDPTAKLYLITLLVGGLLMFMIPTFCGIFYHIQKWYQGETYRIPESYSRCVALLNSFSNAALFCPYKTDQNEIIICSYNDNSKVRIEFFPKEKIVYHYNGKKLKSTKISEKEVERSLRKVGFKYHEK